MSALTTALREVLGLFIEDGALAIAIVIVVIAAGMCAAIIPQPLVAGAVLLAGCVGVLVVNVMRAGRR